MFDPWAIALDAMMSGPGSASAVYVPVSGASATMIRVIRSRPDDTAPFGQGRTVQATNSVDIRVTDAPALAAGDVIYIGAELVAGEPVGGEALELLGTPLRDVEDITFTIGAEPYTA